MVATGDAVGGNVADEVAVTVAVAVSVMAKYPVVLLFQGSRGLIR